MTEQPEIVRASPEWIPSYWSALDRVAREGRYLLFTSAPELSQSKAFVHNIIQNNDTQFYAVSGGEVIGWCDIIRKNIESVAHVGHLGIGIIPEHRGHGVGTLLLRRAMDDAFAKGIERIELGVFASNERAIALYRKNGFVIEGRKARVWRHQNRTEDMLIMARFPTSAKP